MAVRNHSLNPNKPLFSVLDDDDDMTKAFMNSSSAPYLASDKLGYSYEDDRVLSEEEHRRNNLVMQIRQAEQRTLDSSKRTLGMLIESEQIGIETAQDLSRQREQLGNTEKRLDEINYTLKDTQKNINGIKSVFSSLKQWWVTPKQSAAADTTENTKDNSGQTPSSTPEYSKHLASAVENSQLSVQLSGTSHPALRLRGLEEEESTPYSSDLRAHTQRVNQRLDEDLECMSSGLSRLKDLASGLGSEIEDQNEIIGRIHNKADKADLTITSQNSQMKRILKK